MAETTTTKTASTAAKPKAKVASTTSLETGVTKASPINKKGIILGAALVGVLLLSMLIGS